MELLKSILCGEARNTQHFPPNEVHFVKTCPEFRESRGCPFPPAPLPEMWAPPPK